MGVGSEVKGMKDDSQVSGYCRWVPFQRLKVLMVNRVYWVSNGVVIHGDIQGGSDDFDF